MECRNGGKCVARVLGDYVCSCPKPYCGVTCSNISPDCNILFKFLIIFYLFTLFPIGTSSQASARAGDCSANYCNDRGVCLSKTGGGYDCFCSTGWKGNKCEEEDLNKIKKKAAKN